MAQRNLDWHVGWWSEDGLTTGAQSQQVVLTLITDAELLQYEDDLIVERVIGQYLLLNNSETPTIAHLRLAVRPENETAVFTLDTEQSINADEQFMWHKVQYLEGNANNMNAQHPEWSHIDCRVNRRLQGLDRLVLTLDFMDGLVTNPFAFGAWIRVLVKT